MNWIIDVLGICIGNIVCLSGITLLGSGMACLLVKKEMIELMVLLMSLPTAGQPQGPVLMLRGLIHPVDRTRSFGLAGMVIGIIVVLIGGTILKFSL
jgi:hypothetical protein